MKTKFLLALAAACFIAVPAHAETEVFRCGSEIVKIGDSTEIVKRLCGKPSSTRSQKGKESSTKSKKKKNEYGSETSYYKKWYYDRGYGDYVYVLSFKGNTLKKIRKTDRGGK
jgi:hypothetical protein